MPYLIFSATFYLLSHLLCLSSIFFSHSFIAINIFTSAYAHDQVSFHNLLFLVHSWILPSRMLLISAFYHSGFCLKLCSLGSYFIPKCQIQHIIFISYLTWSLYGSMNHLSLIFCSISMMPIKMFCYSSPQYFSWINTSSMMSFWLIPHSIWSFLFFSYSVKSLWIVSIILK